MILRLLFMDNAQTRVFALCRAFIDGADEIYEELHAGSFA